MANESRGPNYAVKLAVERLTRRTPEEVLADRERILAKTPPPRPLPEGKTLCDVVEGTWPSDETDEEIREALEEISKYYSVRSIVVVHGPRAVYARGLEHPQLTLRGVVPGLGQAGRPLR